MERLGTRLIKSIQSRVAWWWVGGSVVILGVGRGGGSVVFLAWVSRAETGTLETNIRELVLSPAQLNNLTKVILGSSDCEFN